MYNGFPGSAIVLGLSGLVISCIVSRSQVIEKQAISFHDTSPTAPTLVGWLRVPELAVAGQALWKNLEIELCSSPLDALSFLRATLAPSERWRIKARGTGALAAVVDLTGPPSSSQMLELLRSIPPRRNDRIVLCLKRPGRLIRARVGVEANGSVGLVPFRLYVRAKQPDRAYGITLYPSPKVPERDVLYALRKRFEIYVATDQEEWEISATIAHELCHCAGMQHSKHLDDIENEARDNARKR